MMDFPRFSRLKILASSLNIAMGLFSLLDFHCTTIDRRGLGDRGSVRVCAVSYWHSRSSSSVPNKEKEWRGYTLLRNVTSQGRSKAAPLTQASLALTRLRDSPPLELRPKARAFGN